MTTRLTQIWQKNGATFSDGLPANQDRFVNHATIFNEITAVNLQLLTDGILLPQDGYPFTLTWTQDNYTLTLVKLISDMVAFDNRFSQYDPQIVSASSDNGWTLVSTENTPESAPL